MSAQSTVQAFRDQRSLANADPAPVAVGDLPTSVESPCQLCLPGFRNLADMGVRTAPRVAQWVLRILARTEARAIYLARRPSPSPHLDGLLGISENELPIDSLTLARSIVRRLEEAEAQPDDGGVVRANVALLAAELGLDAIESEILELRAQIWTQPVLGEIFDLFETRWPDTQLARVLAAACERSPSAVAHAVSRFGKLCRMGLLRIANSVNQTFVGKTGMQFGLSNALHLPANSLEELLSYAIEPAPLATLCSDDFPHMGAELATLSAYLRDASLNHRAGVNILLYGPPGVGKTELARALPQAAGLRCFDVRVRGDNGEPLTLDERLEAYKMTQALLGASGDAIVIFDEIDNALPRNVLVHQERESIKAWLNQALESNPLPAFWIANHVRGIDPAYVRRFDIVLEVKAPPRAVRKGILEQAMDGLPVRPAWIEQQADDAELAPATAKRIARVLEAVGCQVPAEVERMYERLAQGQRVACGHRIRSSYPRIEAYNLGWINADADLSALCATLRQRPRGRLLFHGPPGTGKTALAHHLAEAIDQPLLVKRASDLVSKYLGDTEKNLRDMFDEARADEATILLDEADSFLQDRSLAHRNWEVTEVNELLTQMETFDGLFIAATNFLDHVDPAALRRFGLKLAFRALRRDQAQELFASWYSRLAGRDLTTDEVHSVSGALATLALLVPGDFTAAAARWNFAGHPPTPLEYLDSLRAEHAVKPGAGRSGMGFLADR